jgi:OPA family sugar phosphate sensor protein UhpC-like MFS transporter
MIAVGEGTRPSEVEKNMSAVSNGHYALTKRIFPLTWLSYASYYLTRKNLAVAKVPLEKNFAISRVTLGTMDLCYSASYAAGQFLWGAGVDRYGPKLLLVLGMLSTAVLCLGFSFSSLLACFMVLWTLNGLAQATGWSSNIKAMTPCYGPDRRGKMMGLWSTCYIVGSLIATPLAGTLRHHWGWQAAFFYPALIVASVALIILAAFPQQLFAPAPHGAQRPRSGDDDLRGALLRLPLLWALGAAYFVLKLVRYLFWNWSPYFMETELHYTAWLASCASQLFDLGGIVGAISMGWTSDRWLHGRRLPIIICSIVALALLIPCYGWASRHGLWLNMTVLFFIGFTLFGPDALISAAAAQDLGGPLASGMAAGFINGTGSLGQMFSGPIIRLTQGGAWSTLYYALGGMVIVAALILLPFGAKHQSS